MYDISHFALHNASRIAHQVTDWHKA